jgi:hypothetical protein
MLKTKLSEEQVKNIFKSFHLLKVSIFYPMISIVVNNNLTAELIKKAWLQTNSVLEVEIVQDPSDDNLFIINTWF